MNDHLDFAPPEIAKIMREKAKSYRMIENCENCPFRDDAQVINLRDGRIDEIKDDLDAGMDFYCHKSTYRLGRGDDSVDDEGEEVFVPRKGDLLCHGACQYQDEEGSGPSQYRQIAERLDAIAADRELTESQNRAYTGVKGDANGKVHPQPRGRRGKTADGENA